MLNKNYGIYPKKRANHENKRNNQNLSNWLVRYGGLLCSVIFSQDNVTKLPIRAM